MERDFSFSQKAKPNVEGTDWVDLTNMLSHQRNKHEDLCILTNEETRF